MRRDGSENGNFTGTGAGHHPAFSMTCAWKDGDGHWHRRPQPFPGQANQVRPDDVIQWCGRWVNVREITLTKKGRPGRHFAVRGEDVDGQRLHYYDDEMVWIRRWGRG